MARTRYRDTGVPTPLSALPAAALRAVLREGYSAADLRADILAGLVVGIVALPLAMALAIAVGAPPQHGLYTAIVAGFTIALLGGSRTQVAGPTAAFIVILAPIYAKTGMAGLLLSGMLGGVLLIAMGLLRMGKLIEYIPHPVTTGFTAGIGTVIAALQLQDIFGLHVQGKAEHFFERIELMWDARQSASWWEFAIGVGTLALLVLLPRLTKRLPAPLVALPLAAVAGVAIAHFVPGTELATIGSRFQTIIDGHTVHGIPQLPPLPILPWAIAGADGHTITFSFAFFRSLLPGAFAIAMLGAIESLLSAVVADGMARTHHDPDAELLAQGIGNVVAPFFGGIPATGAIARTATNIRAGGRSPIAAMVHAITILAAILALAPLISYVPMASLAGLLLLVAWNMSEAHHFLHIIKIAPKSDVAVLLTCFGLTVAFDMVVAVSAGIVLAALLFMRRMVEVTHAQITEGTEAHLPRPVPAGVMVYDIAGPLFFGAAQKAMSALGAIHDRAHAVVLRMDQVPAMDASGLVAFESVIEQLEHHRVLIVVTGVQAQPRRVFEHAHIVRLPGRLEFAATIDGALDLAEEHVASTRPPSGMHRRAPSGLLPAG